jgi:predicted TIM-barrel fold metal-dependent hydrolase
MAAELNCSVIELSASVRRPGLAVVAGCTVHPDDDDPAAVLDHAHRGGARVLKLHCSVGDYALDDRRLAETLTLAGELAVPVVVHAGHGIDGGTHDHELDQIDRTAPRHGGTQFILAHLGHPASARGMELLDEHPNLHVDLTPVVDRAIPLERDPAERHQDRILFGSDAPNTGQTVTQLLDHLGRVGLSDIAIERITGANALALVPIEST